MTMSGLITSALTQVERPRRAMLVCVLVIVLSIVFPTDMNSYHATPPDRSPLVVDTNDYLRFINTAAQIAMPVLLGDEIGMMQFLFVALATTGATHVLK